jgi:Zinc carboxypeptidase
MRKASLLTVCLFLLYLSLPAQSMWTDSLVITPERTAFQRTSTYADVVKFLNEVKKINSNIHVFSMGKSLEGRDIPVAVLADPKITSAAEAKASGKLVLYIQGNIHAGEVEGKESVMILIRDILFGSKKYLLDNLVILFVPIYNTDSNDKMGKETRSSQEGSPIEAGQRENSQGLDLNRDGMKMEALETRALFQNVIVPWDPQIFVDLHTTNGTWHAYSLTWAPSYHSAGEYAPYDYTNNKMLPAISNTAREKYDLQFAPYGDYSVSEGWPLKNFYTYNHHPRYLVNHFGLRNRMAILSEAFAHERFYQRINSTYIFVSEILEYTNNHAAEIIATNKAAELATIKNVTVNGGKAKKGVQFKMVPLQKLNNFITYDYFPITDANGKKKYIRTGKMVKYDDVNYYAKFDAVTESTVPRGYVIPAALAPIVANLIMHGIKVDTLTKNQSFSGEIFKVDSLLKEKNGFQKHHFVSLKGKFIPASQKFKKGDFVINMAQPLSNLIFYLLEPQSDDGLAAWNFFDLYLENAGVATKQVDYPVFKYFK